MTENLEQQGNDLSWLEQLLAKPELKEADKNEIVNEIERLIKEAGRENVALANEIAKRVEEQTKYGVRWNDNMTKRIIVEKK